MKNFLSKTKGNYPRSSKGKTFARYLIWICVAFIVLFTLKQAVGVVASVVTTPFFAIRHYFETSTETVPSFFRSRLELLGQIQSLEAEITSQKERDALFTAAMAENAELRTLVSASSSKIIAGVISRPPETPYDTLIIDKGASDGIVEFAPVYYGKGMALGYVRSVHAHSALVTLFSSPHVQSTVYVFGPNLFTTAYGEGSGVVRLSVPQGIVVEEGNAVVLPSLQSGILGVIDAIESVPTEPEQRAYITLDASLQSLRLVSVGTSALRPVSFAEAEAEVREAERALFSFPVPPGARMEFGTTTLPADEATISETDVSTTTP